MNRHSAFLQAINRVTPALAARAGHGSRLFVQFCAQMKTRFSKNEYSHSTVQPCDPACISHLRIFHDCRHQVVLCPAPIRSISLRSSPGFTAVQGLLCLAGHFQPFHYCPLLHRVLTVTPWLSFKTERKLWQLWRLRNGPGLPSRVRALEPAASGRQLRRLLEELRSLYGDV